MCVRACLCQREIMANPARTARNSNLCVQVRHVTMISFIELMMQETARPTWAWPKLATLLSW